MTDSTSENQSMQRYYDIPRLENELHVDQTTDHLNIKYFVKNRLRRPACLHPEAITVYSFANHQFHGVALLDIAESLDSGIYVVPNPLNNVWMFIVEILPKELAEAPLLIFSQSREEYFTVSNYVNQTTKNQRADAQVEMERTFNNNHPAIKDD